MKLREKIMRILAPECERQRMEFREARQRVEAHAEHLSRTLVLSAPVKLEKPKDKEAA